jgi:hypothetical protein
MCKVGKVLSVLNSIQKHVTNSQNKLLRFALLILKLSLSMMVGKRNIIRTNEDLYERWFQCGIKSRLQEMTLPAPKVSGVLSENYQQIITVTGRQGSADNINPACHSLRCGIKPTVQRYTRSYC